MKSAFYNTIAWIMIGLAYINIVIADVLQRIADMYLHVAKVFSQRLKLQPPKEE